MNRLRLGLATLAVGFLFVGWGSELKAADVKTMVGFPTGVVVTLSHKEAQIIGMGQRLNVPALPKRFEAPLHKLAGKIRAADKGMESKLPS